MRRVGFINKKIADLQTRIYISRSLCFILIIGIIHLYLPTHSPPPQSPPLQSHPSPSIPRSPIPLILHRMHHTRIHANSNPRQNPILHTPLAQQDIFHIRIRHLGLLRQNRIILIQRQRLRIVMIWRLGFYAVDEVLIEENAPVVCGLEDVDSVVRGGDNGVVAAVSEDVDVWGDAVVVAWEDGVEGYYAVDLWVRGLVQYL